MVCSVWAGQRVRWVVQPVDEEPAAKARQRCARRVPQRVVNQGTRIYSVSHMNNHTPTGG